MRSAIEMDKYNIMQSVSVFVVVWISDRLDKVQSFMQKVVSIL